MCEEIWVPTGHGFVKYHGILKDLYIYKCAYIFFGPEIIVIHFKILLSIYQNVIFPLHVFVLFMFLC